MTIAQKRPMTGAIAALLLVSTTACSELVSSAASTPPAETPLAPATPSGGNPADTTVEWPVTRCGTYSGTGCAPTADRVDIERPKFSNPTSITNPLFPISSLGSVVLLGEVDGLQFRSETTLIPGEHTVTIDGTPIPVVVSQYTAYLDGRIEEVAVDRYAQSDDGAVWYLGEDVFDYREGNIAITEGSWLAGRDGPPAMIMPANPQVGDIFRAENVAGVVFEELTVTAINQTLDGPRGPVSGIMVADELHLDGSISKKVFAPGYGEFVSSKGGSLEALALAVPTDAIDGPPPFGLRLISTSAWGILENARLEDWEAASPTLARMKERWKDLGATPFPPGVINEMEVALDELTSAVEEQEIAETAQAAVNVAQAALDLELLYRSNVEIDRFHLHSQQLRIHAAAHDDAGVYGEVAVLEWLRDRIAGSLDGARLSDLNTGLGAVRQAASAENLEVAADLAARVAAQLRG